MRQTEQHAEVKCITAKPPELKQKLEEAGLLHAIVVNVGIFAHGGFDGLGIRYSSREKEIELKKDNKALIRYMSVFKILCGWERSLMSVSFFCCYTARPRASAFTALSNLFPSVMFVGFATPLSQSEIIKSKVQYLLEYFALHSVLVDETQLNDETKLKLRRAIVEAAKKKVKEMAGTNSRVPDIVFMNSK